MVIDALQLLKKLEPAVRPSAAPSGLEAARAPFERQGFDELLMLVSAGGLDTGRPVQVAPELSETLEPEQLQRLGAAADRAEAAGGRRALMLIDGRGLLLDVKTRLVSAELNTETNEEWTRGVLEIDTAVYVAGEDEEITPRMTTLPAPGSGVVPQDIARQLARSDRTS